MIIKIESNVWNFTKLFHLINMKLSIFQGCRNNDIKFYNIIKSIRLILENSESFLRQKFSSLGNFSHFSFYHLSNKIFTQFNIMRNSKKSYFRPQRWGVKEIRKNGRKFKKRVWFLKCSSRSSSLNNFCIASWGILK